MNVVHVTHEAVEKIGGIGAVIAGLVTAEAYQQEVDRTILVGPLLQTDQPVNRRLGEHGHVLYSSLDAIRPPEYREKFQAIERTYDVGIIYGRRDVVDPVGGTPVEVEVLVVDVFHANRDRLNLFKAELFRKFFVPSLDFEGIWEYEQYVRLAEPAFEALKALGINGDGPDQTQTVLLAHEYMGMPTALRAILSGSRSIKTVFYAHEVASVRPIVEDVPGHDTMFYNVLCAAAERKVYIDELFPSVQENYKHPLVKAARYCDHVFAVGNYIESELRFLDPHFERLAIDLVYNGIPALPLTLEEKTASRERMKDYAEALYGFRPTWVFTHVARPVRSKGIWRDIQVLEELVGLLEARGETAVLFMLGTLAGQRRPQDIRQMERVYGWPVHHERGYPDLSGGEESLGEMFEAFTAGHETIRACYVNQWDWNRQYCGNRMPAAMDFGDIRRGSDLEFGLSIYEPFGISQFEGLSFGALCVVTDICGCMGFARDVTDGALCDNVIQGSFLEVPETLTISELIAMDQTRRDAIERAEAARLAKIIAERLPRDEASLCERVEVGYRMARDMSWQRVMTEYFLPALSRAASE